MKHVVVALVNTALRIHISESTQQLLPDDFILDYRSERMVKVCVSLPLSL